MNFVLGLRSTVYYIGYILIIGVFSTVGFTIGVLLTYKLRQDMLTLANVLVVKWLKLACNIKLEIKGLENIPPTPFVALSNHQSSWETYYLQRTLRPVSTILKKELLKIPIFGWGLAMTRPIAINRASPRSALRDILSQGKTRLSEGNNVLLYPEGSRMEVGAPGNYGRSGTALAIAAQVPLLPIAHNAGYCWPAHRFLKIPGTIHVEFGKPLSTCNADSKLLTDEIKLWIETSIAAMPVRESRQKI